MKTNHHTPALARHEEVDRDVVVEGILHVFDAGGVEAFHAFGLGERFEGVEGRRIGFLQKII